MPRPSRVLLAILACLSLTLAGFGYFRTLPPGEAMTAAGAEFVKLLTPEQRELTVLAYDAPVRID